MTPVRHWLAFGVSLASVALATPAARAEPTIWARAKSPQVAAEAKLLSAIERTLDARELSEAEPEVSRHIARAAVAMADLSGIRAPKDPRLATLLAEALLAARLGREANARALLERALPVLPDGPFRGHAFTVLGDVLASTGEPKLAIEARTAALRLQRTPGARAGSYYNRGEAWLELGELESARADYLAAIELAREPDVLALARYGLGVALERLGDLPAAYDALDAANAVRLPVPAFPASDPLELPGVYFAPAYERSYLEALRSMARARRAPTVEDRRLELSNAVDAWDAFLEAAPESVPHRRNASAHRKRSAEELERLERQP